MLTYFPSFKRVWTLEKAAYVSPFTWHCTWAPTTVWSREASVNLSRRRLRKILRRPSPHWRRQAAPSKSPATKSTCSSSITARKSKEKLLPNAALFGTIVVDVQRHHCEERFAPLGCRRKDALDMTPCNTHPDSTSFTLSCWEALM